VSRELHPDCRFWLGRIDGNVVHLEDGCHGGPEGVAEAAKLIKRIFHKDGPWVMVELHEMPDLDPPINDEAADACAYVVAEFGPSAQPETNREEQ
jgi:hypothetical protein